MKYITLWAFRIFDSSFEWDWLHFDEARHFIFWAPTIPRWGVEAHCPIVFSFRFLLSIFRFPALKRYYFGKKRCCTDSFWAVSFGIEGCWLTEGGGCAFSFLSWAAFWEERRFIQDFADKNLGWWGLKLEDFLIGHHRHIDYWREFVGGSSFWNCRRSKGYCMNPF